MDFSRLRECISTKYRGNSHIGTLIFALAACTVLCPGLRASITVSAATSLASPQPVATPIPITASAVDSGAGPVNYLFEVADATGVYVMKKDFSLDSTFTWAQTASEGSFMIRVTARDNGTQETSQVVLPFTVTSRVTGGKPVISATQHPLVPLFSAPACPAGSQMRVKFYLPAKAPYNTDFRPCTSTSMNFLIAGLRASNSSTTYTYSMFYEIQTGSTITPDTNVLSYTTGQVPAQIVLGPFNFPVPASGSTSSESIAVMGSTGGPRPFANDMSGHIVWYYNNSGLFQLTRMVQGGGLMVLAGGNGTGSGVYGLQTKQWVLREEDLAGNILHETNCDRVSEQLGAAVPNGLDRFNHEARKLPNGDYLVLGETQQIFPPGTQGYTTSIDLIGGVVLILDSNFQLKYFWSTFDHDNGTPGNLKINRRAQYAANCSPNAQGQTPSGCPPAVLASPAYDWLHSNSLQMTPDGNILLSMRNQNWLAKIDYQNGAGTNNLDWIMGVGGDFAFVGSTDPYPWFSGQHDANFQFNGMTTLSVFDDSDERYNQKIGTGNSRGMVLSVDESALTVSSILTADLGYSSLGLGSAQPLANGDWFFASGEIRPSLLTSQAIEIAAPATQTFHEDLGVSIYRAFRLTDFYNVPIE